MAITLTRKKIQLTNNDIAFKVYLDGDIVAKIYEEETVTIPLSKSQAILTVKPFLARKVSINVTDGDDLVLVANHFNQFVFRYFRFYWMFLILSIFIPIPKFILTIFILMLLSAFLFPIFDIKKIEASQENNPIKIE
ncbi:hypothetical protein [Streptococcus sp. CSL10205-OR2]|uniref:hypothetical protein n=1 Tax=Streptococcus sp. CSL10205-OR2 TaxID=2980558 RepID=UPI0021DB2121|nr:hypothetical protein [Streptococcus sp. CSL10205-OR2]MCU9533725.1 hypothetical protein [Streptococcus sp. CSL10205-OR2]